MLMLSTSCDNWLDIQPSDRIAEKRVFSTVSGFWGALNGVYTEMISTSLYGGFLSYEGVELMAQRYNINSSSQASYYSLASYSYTNDYAKGRLQSYWESAYKQILDCNKILENAELYHGEVLNDKQYNIVKAEAMALRAFLHFDLLRVFGPVPNKLAASAIPYRTEATTIASEILTAEKVLELIQKDLNEAESILLNYDPAVTAGLLMSENDDEFDNDGNTYRFRGLRMNYYAVVALRARVYLWAGNTTKALEYATKIIDNPNADELYPPVSLTSVMNANNPDRAFSTEALFSMLNNDKNKIFENYFQGLTASLNFKLTPMAGRIESLFGNDAVTDYRYKWWQTSNGTGEESLLMNIRLKGITSTSLPYANLMPLIRVSEMYLIAAECATNPDEQFRYLNDHRRRRGNPVEKTADDTDLNAELALEYSREFLCEGQLWFYYKRTNTPLILSGSASTNYAMSDARYVPALPDSELQYRN